MTAKRRQPVAVKAGAGGYRYVEERLNGAGFVKRSLNKVFPDHWSFMLGEIALYSFIILLLSGTFLTMWFIPSDNEVIYNGNYVPLRGLKVTEAYASTLEISFNVRGGLLLRQVHHWAALIFVAAMAVHSMRVFFTGAFRKPRELNWVIGVGLLTLGIFEGFAGYSLPDDLLSGTGLRIGYSIVESIPVVGTWLAMFLFGGEFPGHSLFHRLYIAHVLLLPGLILALITVHMMILWHQKHTQFAGVGKTEENVVGSRLFPSYAAKGQGYFFLVFGVIALLGGIVQINPIWYWGPYNAGKVSSFSQPDWYVGWMDGALRLMPGAEWRIWGATIPYNVFIPAVVLPGLIFTSMALYPFIEQRFITRDRNYHHLLDRPRDNPIRTALGVMSIVFYAILLLAGSDDEQARVFKLSIFAVVWFYRGALILAPALAYYLTKRVCLGLQRKEDEEIHHGVESGTIKRLPHGEFIEVHVPMPASKKAVVAAAEVVEEGVDSDAVPVGAVTAARSRIGDFFYGRRDVDRS